MPKSKKHPKGFTDIGRLVDHLDEKERKERRLQWLKEHGKQAPNTHVEGGEIEK